MARSRVSVHFSPIKASSVLLGNEIDRVLGYLDDQVPIPDLGLAGKARFGFQPPGLVEQVLFLFLGRLEAGEALAHHHVAGGAGAGFFPGVLDPDTGVERSVTNTNARLHLDGLALGAYLRMRKKSQTRHGVDLLPGAPNSSSLRPVRSEERRVGKE